MSKKQGKKTKAEKAWEKFCRAIAGYKGGKK